MKSLQRKAILTVLTEKLRDNGNWCGETHLQKAVYCLTDFLDLSMDFDFILYKHGPYSFDLRDELTSMRADDLLKLEPQAPPYGPKIITTEQGRNFTKNFPKTLEKYNRQLEFIAEKLSDKGVSELERLATALYVTKRIKTDCSIEERASELIRIKPHITPELAREAIEEVDKVIEGAKGF
ncbi:MAG: hypothetical protein HQK89_12000 [Nitrospirae bacterium]|nr:hypothetical protein [Nitrospirota bacterium]